MNVKLHTPKSLKAGSGIATLKQFLKRADERVQADDGHQR